MVVVGDPAIVAETPMVTEGWGSGVDGTWTVARTRPTAKRAE